MKKLLLIFVTILGFCACKKEPDANTSRMVAVDYVTTANNLPANAKIERCALGAVVEFTDTITTAYSQKIVQQQIFYVQCPTEINFTATILNDGVATDSIYTQIFIDGALKAQSTKVGRNEYYRAEITYNINW